MNLLSFLIYLPLQIAFIPLTIVGGIWVAYKQLVVSSRQGLSHTAIEIINGRWTMHIFGLRDDPATAKLAGKLNNTSTFGLWLALFPLWVKYRISGKYFLYPKPPEQGKEGIVDLVPARTIYIDQMINRIAETAEQFVAMGAGYDTRSFDMLSGRGLQCFELDQQVVQAHKRQYLELAGVATEDVRFLTVDFSKENSFEKLIQSGFDPTSKSLFLWEGVTLYLSEEEVRNTLRDFRDQAPVGSVLIADIYANRFLAALTRSAGARKSLEATNEMLNFGLDFEAGAREMLQDFIESESLKLGETHFLGRDNENGPFAAVFEVSASS
ncbi:MAG: class I SAM-dependent methyltransferase [Pseudomonadales bacterium]|nr:class I SAM-dependent methyltransferase [Pseudomonadales bacterium]MBO6595805.1 class I SAM-dependent methyltransferase [Pseudomonadales bacterium]MBO6822289.1 class I SAM-dependent methyltransferase [Pseudomonadales bacterium]